MKRKVHILIIEDNEDDTILEIDELKNGGFDVKYQQIQSREELIEALKEPGWDCIISDYSMPQFSGLEALDIVREFGTDIPFILVSGAMGEETAVAAMKAGAHDYIMKNNLARLVPAFERELREAGIRMQNKKAEQTIRYERKLLRTLIDNLPDRIFVKDLSGQRIISNHADYNFWGFETESEIIGKTDEEISLNDTGNAEASDDIAILQRGEPVINREEVITDSYGKQRWFLCSKIPVRNGLNDLSSLVSLYHEITERKLFEMKLLENEQNLKQQNNEYLALNEEYLTLNEELEEKIHHIEQINRELIVSKNKAEEADKLKSAFLANMSHEIRTPLNAIMGFSGLLKNKNLGKDKTEMFVDIIDSSGQQLLTIINDILDISKIEAGQVSISPGPVKISMVMNELYEQFEKQAREKNISLLLQNNLSDLNIEIITDEIRLRQVLTNLINNAIKFTHVGQVQFGVNTKNEFYEFFVTDTGIGISHQDQSIIFEPFRQVETTNSRIYGGNGLGLSISRALVEKLGGTISVSSIQGRGSTFSFTIPMKFGDVIHAKLRTPIPLNNWDKHIILIAEDEFYNYQFLEEILSPTHIKIIHARDGKEAVELVRKNPQISLVLMDIKMPIMDGYTATKIIKAFNPKLPIIAQTAYAMNGDKEKSRQAGFDDFIDKPIIQDHFIKVIGDYMD